MPFDVGRSGLLHDHGSASILIIVVFVKFGVSSLTPFRTVLVQRYIFVGRFLLSPVLIYNKGKLAGIGKFQTS